MFHDMSDLRVCWPCRILGSRHAVAKASLDGPPKKGNS